MRPDDQILNCAPPDPSSGTQNTSELDKDQNNAVPTNGVPTSSCLIGLESSTELRAISSCVGEPVVGILKDSLIATTSECNPLTTGSPSSSNMENATFPSPSPTISKLGEQEAGTSDCPAKVAEKVAEPSVEKPMSDDIKKTNDMIQKHLASYAIMSQNRAKGKPLNSQRASPPNMNRQKAPSKNVTPILIRKENSLPTEKKRNPLSRQTSTDEEKVPPPSQKRAKSLLTGLKRNENSKARLMKKPPSADSTPQMSRKSSKSFKHSDITLPALITETIRNRPSLSASMTPATEDDSGEERRSHPPSESVPASKSSSSPSSTSFTTSRSATPVSQKSLEQERLADAELEMDIVLPTFDVVEKVVLPTEDEPVRVIGGRQHGSKKRLNTSQIKKKGKEAADPAALKSAHRERSLLWFFLRVLEHGMKTVPINAKEQKKVEKYIHRRLNEDSMFLECPVTLDFVFPDYGNYRECRQFLVNSTIRVVAPKRKIVDLEDENEEIVGTKMSRTESGEQTHPAEQVFKTHLRRTVPPYTLYGDLLVPLDISSKRLIQRAGQRMKSNRNEVYKHSYTSTGKVRVESPTPNENLFQTELNLYQKLMEEELGRMTRHNRYRLPVPLLKVTTPEEILDERFHRILTSASITNVDGFGKALGIDMSKFTVEAISAANPDLIMDELRQIPQSCNYNYTGEFVKGWAAYAESRKMRLADFAEEYIRLEAKCREVFKQFVASKNLPETEKEIIETLQQTQDVHPEDDPSMYWTRFGTNIDIRDGSKFVEQFKEISKFPNFMKPERDGNLINLPTVGQEILGVNTVQMYVKAPGARTCAHMENSLMASINWNIGPGTCVWYGVPYEYYGRIKEMVYEEKQSYFRQDYWPDEVALLKANIPVIKFEQKADQLVYVNTGCFHWVQSNGFCANVSWNVGQPSFTQLATTMISYSDDLYELHQHHFPLVTTAWTYAKKKMYMDDEDMYKVIRSILIRSLAYVKMKYDVYVNTKTPIIPRTERPDFLHLNRCYSCMQEIFNIVDWYIMPIHLDPFKTPEENQAAEDAKLAEEARAAEEEASETAEDDVTEESEVEKVVYTKKHNSYCESCAKQFRTTWIEMRKETTMYYSLPELAEIFDGYQKN